MTPAADDNAIAWRGAQGYNCSHYKSALYGKGKTPCPWKDKYSAIAKEDENTFMVRMAGLSNKLRPPTP